MVWNELFWEQSVTMTLKYLISPLFEVLDSLYIMNILLSIYSLSSRYMSSMLYSVTCFESSFCLYGLELAALTFALALAWWSFIWVSSNTLFDLLYSLSILIDRKLFYTVTSSGSRLFFYFFFLMHLHTSLFNH